MVANEKKTFALMVCVVSSFLFAPVYGMRPQWDEKLYENQRAAFLHTLNIYSRTPNCAAVRQAQQGLAALEQKRKTFFASFEDTQPQAKTQAQELKLTTEELAFIENYTDEPPPVSTASPAGALLNTSSSSSTSFSGGPFLFDEDLLSTLNLSNNELQLNGLLSPQDNSIKYSNLIKTAAKNFENVVKTATIDAHAVSAQIKATHPVLFEAADAFFGKPPAVIPAAQVTNFFQNYQASIQQMLFFDLDKRPLKPDFVTGQFLQGWSEHAGKKSNESGLAIDQIRAITFHALEQMFTKIGLSNETQNCLERFLTQGSDAKGTCLEGHTNRHYLTLLFILQAYAAHI